MFRAVPSGLLFISIILGASLLYEISNGQQLEATRLLPVLEQQRNAALNLHAQAEARAAQLLDDNVKLKAEIEELKKKLAPEAK
jgi:cell division protein FtsB